MTLVRYSLDGTDGVSLSAGNTGAQQVTGGASTTSVFSAADAINGATSALFTTAGNNRIARFEADSPNNTMAIAVDFTVKATPGASITVATCRHTSGGALTVAWTTTDAIWAQSTGAAALVVVESGGVTPGQPYRLEARLISATTTTGQWVVRIYESNTMTVVGEQSATGVNLSTNQLAAVDVGVVNVPGVAAQVVIDNVALNDGSTQEIGPVEDTTPPPTASAGASQMVDSLSTVTLTGTPGGDYDTQEWTQLSGPPVTALDGNIGSPDQVLRTNYCTNGSFEADTAGWSTSNASLTRTDDEADVGTYSVAVTPNGNGAAEGIYMSPVTRAGLAGKTVTCQAAVKAPNGQLMLLSVSEIGTGAWHTTFTGTGDWQTVTVTSGTLSTGAAYPLVRTAASGGATFYVDAVMIGATGTYFDGNTTPAGGKQYRTVTGGIHEEYAPEVPAEPGDGTATFTAPADMDGTECAFRYTVTGPGGVATDDTNATIRPHNEWLVTETGLAPLRYQLVTEGA